MADFNKVNAIGASGVKSLERTQGQQQTTPQQVDGLSQQDDKALKDGLTGAKKPEEVQKAQAGSQAATPPQGVQALNQAEKAGESKKPEAQLYGAAN